MGSMLSCVYDWKRAVEGRAVEKQVPKTEDQVSGLAVNANSYASIIQRSSNSQAAGAVRLGEGSSRNGQDVIYFGSW